MALSEYCSLTFHVEDDSLPLFTADIEKYIAMREAAKPKSPPRPKNRAERRKHLQDAWQIKAHLDTI